MLVRTSNQINLSPKGVFGNSKIKLLIYDLELIYIFDRLVVFSIFRAYLQIRAFASKNELHFIEPFKL